MGSSSDNRLHVAIVFGGRSGEHEISLRSARSVVDAIDRSKYRVSLLGIDKRGHWYLLDEGHFRSLTDASLPALEGGDHEIILAPAPATGELLAGPRPGAAVGRIDVVFPVLHGPYGEDGSVQGLLELADLPYVGAGVLGSALGMDKDVQKRLLQAAGIAVVPFVTVHCYEWATPAAVYTRLGDLHPPLFVKPANLGSSVGVSKVPSIDALPDAMRAAFAYDTKVLIERAIDGREIECAVLGNDVPDASVPGEIVPQGEFYSYEAKYVDEHGAVLRIPAPLTDSETAAVRDLAVRAFTTLECSGMARVDFFLERASGRLYVNEINTIPGFTSISMYPKLWEASGLPYRDLISRLIELACERHAQRARLAKSYSGTTS
jgi:D-alanine-D-alanine ligase